MSSTFIDALQLAKMGLAGGEPTFLRRRRPALLRIRSHHGPNLFSRVYLAHRRISDPGLICCGLPVALSRQRLNRDAFLSAAAIRL
jgi:hypothetical protein